MTDFQFEGIGLEGAYLIRHSYSNDNRGTFVKNYERDKFAEAGIEFKLNESFISCSMKNVIRGLHFQLHLPQAKIVSVVAGKVWDVIVDLRTDSPTYMQWRGSILSSDNHLSFFVPRGFAHGFACLEDNTAMLYQCDGKYDKESDTGIRFNDPDIGIEWPIEKKKVICSKRDLQLQNFTEFVKISQGGGIFNM